MKKLTTNPLFLLLMAVTILSLPACKKQKEGCMDSTASNYDPTAEIDDGSCDAAVKRIFTTKATYAGNFMQYCPSAATGIEAADCICNNTAQGAGLGGTWKAWISDANTNAIDRIADVGPWYFVDGTTKIFNNKTNMTTTPIRTIARDENGSVFDSQQKTWTGTEFGGTASICNCNNWNDTNLMGTEGWVYGSNSTWTDNGCRACVVTNHIYCIEQ